MAEGESRKAGCLLAVVISVALFICAILGLLIFKPHIPNARELFGPEESPSNPAAGPRDTWNPEVLRTILEREYLDLVKLQFQEYNFIAVKSVKKEKGFRLLATHEFFGQYQLETGPFAKKLSSWIDKHRSELVQAKIIYVGLSNRAYGGATGFSIQ